MSYDWCEFLDLALALEGGASLNPLPDAALRTAISRAYYACFCSAREYVTTQPGAPRLHHDASAHRRLADYLIVEGQQLGNGTLLILGRALRQLRMQRNDADYEDVLPRLPDEARKAIHRANDIIDRLRHLGWTR